MTQLCPDCSAALDATTWPRCGSCGLALTGPTAGRLWVVDQRLLALTAETSTLTLERTSLLGQLRVEEPSVPAQPVETLAPRVEASPRSVQNTLLALGALLLAGAGLVFAAVTYNQLGATGRALVLTAVTVAAVVGAQALLRKGLRDSADAVGAVAVVLAVADTWALRRAGLGADLDPKTYAAIASGVLAGLSAAWGLRSSRTAGVLLAQLPAVLVLAEQHASLAVASVVLVALGAADLALARGVAPVRRVATAVGALVLAAAGLTGLLDVAGHHRGGAVGLAAVAAAVATQGVLTKDRSRRAVLLGAAPVLVAVAAWGAVRDSLGEGQLPLVAVAVGLLALQASALLDRTDRNGPVVGSLLVLGAGLVAEAPSAALALAGPFTWLGHPWTLTATSARAAVSVHAPWTGTIVTLVVLLGAAAAALISGLLTERLTTAAVPAGALVTVSALLLPLGIGTSFHVGLAVVLVEGAVLAGAGLLLKRPEMTVTGMAAALLAAIWSLAEQDATLAVLPVVAVLAGALSVRLPGLLTTLALALAGGELAACGATRALAVDQVGALLLIAAAVAVAASFVLPERHRLGSEGGAVVLASASIALTSGDPGWSAWSLAAIGLLCLVVATRTDRRFVGVAGGLLLSASSWVRLADAHVSSPEPYVVPLAVAALLIGFLRRRKHPTTGSFEAYGAGLSLALVPSLLKALSEAGATRGLLLLVVAAAVVLAGTKDRLRAPLAIGGGVLTVDALHLLAPYADALPRWVVLAAVGALLVAVGATYERDLRDVTRMRERYETWV